VLLHYHLYWHSLCFCTNTCTSTVSAFILSLKLAQKVFSSAVCALWPCCPVALWPQREITKWQIYKTGEKEDASFMAYFVVEALSNCTCRNWYKEILQRHLNSWRDSSRTFVTYLYSTSLLLSLLHVISEDTVPHYFRFFRSISWVPSLFAVSHIHLMVRSFTVFSIGKGKGKAIPSQDWIGITVPRGWGLQNL
jgi:hypothetical protein